MAAAVNLEMPSTDWSSLVRLAERLDVGPVPSGESRPVLVFVDEDSLTAYDPLEIAHAFLDRMAA